MSRDMKPQRSRQPAKNARGGTLIGMFIGLVLGVGVAAGVVWYMNKTPVPFVNKPQAVAKGGDTQGSAGQNGSAGGKSAPAAGGEPMALPGKPGDPIPEKRFQFYDILPGKADAVPDAKKDDKKEEAKKDEAKKDEKKDDKKDAKESKDAKDDQAKESKQPLFLQAGSFSNAGDADNLKAKLAFMGMETAIQQVMIQDKTFYRVRTGPYYRVDELNKVRAELAKAGIDAQLAKNKEQ